MSGQYQYPKLRWPIELRIEAVENQEILVVNCPLGITENPLLLISAVSPIISCFDGSTTVEQILDKFSGYGIKRELVDELIAILDANLFLATPSFFAAEKRVREEFSSSPIRSAALAGRAYSNSKAHLEGEIDSYLMERPLVFTPDAGKLVSLVSPHIDYRRGGACYGKTYSYLRGVSHDLYILIGTSHQFSRNLFHLTRKDFDNPIARLPADRDFIDRVASRYGEKRSYADEFLHRREHSLELQVPFLARTVGSPKIAPILVGSFHHMISSGKLPNEHEEYDAFASALAESIREEISQGRTVCCIAGVDMAHVGRAFGDKDALTPGFMEHVALRDREYLDAIANHDKRKLFAHIAEDGDARKICGFPTMYTLLDVFERIGIKYNTNLFDYQQAVDYPSDCAVTFAGIGLYR